MSGSRATQALIAAVVVLGTIWFLSDRFTPAVQQRTFRDRVLEVDTTALRSFVIVPSVHHGFPPLNFQRVPGGWIINSDGHTVPADHGPMMELLSYLADLHTERMAGKLSAVKDLYQLGDTSADKLILDLPGGQRTLLVGAWHAREEQSSTGVNLLGEEDVFTVQGALGKITDMSLLNWIPKPMVNGDPRNWRSVSFMFPNRSGYSMLHQGDRWTLNGLATDSVKVAKFIRNLSRYRGEALVDPADTLNAQHVYSIVVDDTTKSAPMELGIFDLGDRMIARSTLAPPNIVMPFDRQVELPRMFRDPRFFLP